MGTLEHKAGKVTIKIPRQLYEKIAEAIEGAGYNSVTDFVVYVMRDLVANHQMANHKEPVQDQMDKVRQRLRALGYFGEQ